jgi:hypothetical protein
VKKIIKKGLIKIINPIALLDMLKTVSILIRPYSDFDKNNLLGIGTSKLVKKSFQDILDATSKLYPVGAGAEEVRFILRLWIEMIVVLFRSRGKRSRI